eukprot:g33767.t1
MATCRLVAVAALVIAICWTSGVFTTKLLTQNCGYRKPYLLTYLHELGATAISVPFACSQQLWPRCKIFGLRAMGLANISFMVALVLTTASSAMTLEQLTPVFIAGFSCIFLKERYQACQIFWLAVAIMGSVIVARSDLKACHGEGCSGSMPLLGDGLVVVCCVTAALYMVLFKMWFARNCTSPQLLFTYFIMKGMSVSVLGGIILLFLSESHRGLPTDTCGWGYLSINMIANMCFNLSLAWGILLVSPLACRLFVLLGLPVSLLLDSVLGVSISLWRVLGVAVVACGVAGFEWAGTVRSRAGADHGAPVEAEELSSICEDSSSGQSSCSSSRPKLSSKLSSTLCGLVAVAVCAAGFAISSTHHSELR